MYDERAKRQNPLSVLLGGGTGKGLQGIDVKVNISLFSLDVNSHDIFNHGS